MDYIERIKQLFIIFPQHRQLPRTTPQFYIYTIKELNVFASLIGFVRMGPILMGLGI